MNDIIQNETIDEESHVVHFDNSPLVINAIKEIFIQLLDIISGGSRDILASHPEAK